MNMTAPLPKNDLPSWHECSKRVDRPESDGCTLLEQFIYEYDDADPARSAWFLHRLEMLLKETAERATTAALANLSARPGVEAEAAKYRWLRDNCSPWEKFRDFDAPYATITIHFPETDEQGVSQMRPGPESRVGIPSLDQAIALAQAALTKEPK